MPKAYKTEINPTDESLKERNKKEGTVTRQNIQKHVVKVQKLQWATSEFMPLECYIKC